MAEPAKGFKCVEYVNQNDNTDFLYECLKAGEVPANPITRGKNTYFATGNEAPVANCGECKGKGKKAHHPHP